jgi:hypothetical protein
MAVRSLNIAPSEFWNMVPRHFWYLVETLQPPKGAGPRFSEAERDELIALLNAAERGEI